LSAVFGRPDVSCIPAAYLIQFRFDESANPYFVRYCLQAPSIQHQLLGRGTTVQNLNAKKIKSTFIPFPPLPVQRQIVAHLDDLQAKVDTVKKLQDESEAELNALMPSILSRAFAGDL
jgi:type I restriction enzyme S subunit